MKYIVMTLSIFLILFLIPNDNTLYADHGGGTSGGCSGDCTPPTIGIDNGGRQVVSEGISINEASFDVKHYKQDIPTQVIKVNEPVKITLKIYENSSPESLMYVGLRIGSEDKLTSGVMVKIHKIQIHWEKDFEGNTSIEIENPHNLIKDINVEGKIEKTNSIITFEFTPIETFDTETISVQMWDTKRNLWTNYFYNSMKIISNENSIQTTTDQHKIPTWVKNNAGWWAEGMIDDDSFIQGIKFLIKEDILKIPPTTQGSSSSSNEIPSWIKNNAGWWAEGMIDDDSFIQGIQFLMSNGVIIA